MTALISSNEEMDSIMKIVKSVVDADLLIKSFNEKVKNETKKGGFISMLLGTLGASLLENLLTDNGVIQAGEGVITANLGQGTIRIG